MMPRKGPVTGKTLYTAEELLKTEKYKITGRLKKEIDKIESKFDKRSKPKKKVELEVEAKDIVDEVCKKRNIAYVLNDGRYNIKNRNRIFALITDRKNYVSVSTWDIGGKNFQTKKIRFKKEVNAIVEELKRVNK